MNVFEHFTRQEWSQLYYDGEIEAELIADLDELVAVNDRLTQADIDEIYQPLIQYIDIFVQKFKRFELAKINFFAEDKSNLPPFIIGISGSVAVGKSTVARVLQELLQRAYPAKTVEMMTTDGFLYSNRELKRRGISNRKGFPESYDMVALLDFMSAVKTQSGPVSYPIYSHDIYDVIPGKKRTIEAVDILIVEGINTFQLPQNQQIYVSDFIDFGIYVDADPLNIKKWYIQRFHMHLEHAQDNPDSYYYPMTFRSQKDLDNYANEVWYTVNMTNLVQYIEPTRDRADLVLHKGDKHLIDELYIRKY
ncbi:type I pantothenate kinase [Hutsoniella sourekii]